jgi:hypothetical protein
VGIFLHGAFVTHDGAVEGGEQPRGAVVAEWSPVGVAPVSLRARTWADGELVSAVEFLKSRLIGLAAAVMSALMASAVAWWRLSRPDCRLGAPFRCASLAALRAPPALL